MPPSPDPIPRYTPGETQTIVCLHCGQSQQVGKRAMTIVCKYCHKSLKLEDLVIKEYMGRRAVETVGVITVEKKGNVSAERLLCAGMIVRGKVKGNVTSKGPVLVGPEAELKGDVTAPTIAIGAGAILDGNYNIGKKPTPTEPPPSTGDAPAKK